MEFVTALQAKGMRDDQILRHVLKNAAPTCLAVMGLQAGNLIGGSILIETVFAWPGTGFLLNSAIFRRDLPILQGTTLVLAGFFMLLNLTVDIIQTMVDPRIKRRLTAMTIQSPSLELGARPGATDRGPRRPRLLAVGAPPPAARSGDADLCRHPDPARRLRACRALAGAGRSLQDLDDPPALSAGLARSPAGHRRARPRHAFPPDLWRPAVALHGRDAGASARS